MPRATYRMISRPDSDSWQRPMPLPFDATLKTIVAERPGDFAAVFGLPTSEPVCAVNVDLSTISAATDVALAYGEPIREIVDLNFQTGPDAGLPGRLHLYNAALHSRHDVAVRSILVLLRPKADAPNLTGSLAYGEGRCRVEFGYDVIRLWQQPVANYLHAGLAALPLATLCQMPTGQPLPAALREVVREIERRLGKEATHAEAIRLMTAAYILTGLRVKKNDLATIYRGVGLMTESTAYDEAIEEGLIRGRSEGRTEGRSEGELARSHRLLLRLGRRQFGVPDLSTEAELTSIRDLDHLERLADAILTANSWKELLSTP